MAKLIMALLFAFIGLSILSGIMAGGGGITATRLNGTVNATATTLTVDSTNGYLDADYIMVGDEKVLYSGKTSVTFTGCTRGYDGTDAEAHADNAMVYSADASVVNAAMGFSAAATADTMGVWATLAIPFKFFTKTVPHIMAINWSFLGSELAFLGYFYYIIGIALVVSIAIYMAGGRRI